jgi:hypothetical protein
VDVVEGATSHVSFLEAMDDQYLTAGDDGAC